MNTLSKIVLSALTLTAITCSAHAENPDSKLVQNAKEAVANATDNFSEIYAQSAEICLMKKENLKLAYEWIEIAVSINETPYNLEVMGDFLAAMNKKQEAIAHYHKAVIKAKEANPLPKTTSLQQKIWNLR